MIKKRDKKTIPYPNDKEQECCELYGEYCYPCGPTNETGKQNRHTAPRRPQRGNP